MSRFQTKIIKELKAMGYKTINIIRLSENGYPDLMAMKEGKTIWIECKEKDDTLKPLQKFRIDQLIKNGFEAKCLQDGKGQIYP